MKVALSREKQDRHQCEHRDEDWKHLRGNVIREVSNLVPEEIDLVVYA